MEFTTTAISVLLLVAMAIPGFLLTKSKLVKPSAIAYFAAVLLYVCQPFLSLRSFLQVQYSLELLKNLGIVFGFTMVTQIALFLVLYFVLKRKFDKPEITASLIAEGYIGGNTITNEPALNAQIKSTVRGRAYRVMVLASTFGNVGFFGVPVLQMLFPSHPEAIAYSAICIVSMNLMCWTVGAYVLTGDKKYIKIKKAIFNPQMLTLFIALPLFFAGVTINSIPEPITKVIGYLADMTAPLCMLILGMRFAVAPMKELFTDWKVYVITAIKIVIFPLIVFLVLMPFHMDSIMRATLVILSGMPCASINLNLAELYGADQKTAANSILLSTLLCIITIPLIMLLVPIT
ncbi:MAG: AEC family transporter [Clostridia bacterium]